MPDLESRADEPLNWSQMLKLFDGMFIPTSIVMYRRQLQLSLNKALTIEAVRLLQYGIATAIYQELTEGLTH